ncbi:hypothetical protein ACFWMJ_37095 [Streptomyces hawaiiensis]|uniref:hypothetical protein n=1 Tax=Streptomyces hawaiiensis TaxID=67305 RepID=UPI003649AD4F
MTLALPRSRNSPHTHGILDAGAVAGGAQETLGRPQVQEGVTKSEKAGNAERPLAR